MPSYPFSIFVIGETGNGKSQFCQYLTKSDSFHPSEGTDSFTQQVSFATSTIEICTVTVYDTPGLNDKRKDADAEHIAEMVSKLRSVANCKAFLIVLNPHQPRFSASTKSTIEYFRDIFGRDIVTNLGIVWTKVSKKKAEFWRKKKEAEYVGMIQELFGSVGHIPSFYVNSVPDDEEYEYDHEFHWGEVKKLLTWANANPYKDCSGAKVVETKESKLEMALEEKKKAEEEIARKQKEAEKAEKKRRKAEEKLAEEQKKADSYRKEIEAEEGKRRDLEAELRRERNKNEEKIADLTKLVQGMALKPQPQVIYVSPSKVRDYNPPSPSKKSPSQPRGSGSSPRGSASASPDPGQKFYKGGQFMPGGGRAPKGGVWGPASSPKAASNKVKDEVEEEDEEEGFEENEEFEDDEDEDDEEQEDEEEEFEENEEYEELEDEEDEVEEEDEEEYSD